MIPCTSFSVLSFIIILSSKLSVKVLESSASTILQPVGAFVDLPANLAPLPVISCIVYAKSYVAAATVVTAVAATAAAAPPAIAIEVAPVKPTTAPALAIEPLKAAIPNPLAT